ncbi:MAG: FG-GAP-like repeat-containing protein [Bacteroidota bacterium]
MKKNYIAKIVFCLIYFSITINAKAQTSIPAGLVSGTWSLAGSPYLIQGSIQIANGATLTIQPGVTVNFQGMYKINVQGRLIAIGTASNTITFTATDTTNGWRGIRFESTPVQNDTSKFIYCNIQYGKANGNNPQFDGGAFYFYFGGKAIINHCNISNCIANRYGGAIYCVYANPIISQNNITNNFATNAGGAILCDGGNPSILNNLFSNNSTSGYGGGICCQGNPCNPDIINNIISNNTAASHGGGFFFERCTSNIINNTIVNNSAIYGGAIFCDLFNPSFRNCIIWGNTSSVSGSQVYLNYEDADPNFYNCDIQGGSAAIEVNGNVYTGIYQNNINANPLFVAPSTGSGNGFNGVTADWSIQNTSPCINVGDFYVNYTNTDLAGNTRLVGCSFDLGAYENQFVGFSPITIISQPVSQFVMQGAKTSFSITASCPANQHYKWQYNGLDISNSDTCALILYPMFTDSGNYRCIVYNSLSRDTSNYVNLSIIPLPVVTSFTPTSGNIGTIVTIKGAHFNDTISNNIVYFGATRALVTAVTDSSLNVIVPFGATYESISILNSTLGMIAYSSKPFIVTYKCGGRVNTNSFSQKVTSYSGYAPCLSASGDLDGDGKLDFIVAMGYGAAVRVFRNISTMDSIILDNGINYTASGGFVNSVKIADLDGDGKLDIAVVNMGANSISLFRNTSTLGAISFASKIDFPTGLSSFDLAIGDFDNDGKADIAVGSYDGTGTVSVLKNNCTIGNFLFSSPAIYNTNVGSNTYCIGISDLNSDGKPDLVIVNQSSNTFAVLKNTSTIGNIYFATKVNFTTELANPFEILIADFEDDGKPEIAVTYSNANIISVYKNTCTLGTISFAPKVDYPSIACEQSAIADIDGDSKLDIITSSGSIFKNTSAGGVISFNSAVNFDMGSSNSGIVIGDFNNDGKPDIITSSNASNSYSILKNQIYISPTMTSATTKLICNNNSVNFTLSSDIASSYSWIANNNPNINGESLTLKTSATINDTLINTTTSIQNVTYTVTPSSIAENCVGTPQIITISVNPLFGSSGTISGSTTVCQGQNNVNYSIPLITNATSYIWSLPIGATGTSTTNNITVNYGTSSVSGNITVKGQNTCGNGDTSILTITVNPLPSNASVIIGDTTVCQGQNSVVYTVPSITNATSYVWTLPSGTTGTSDSNSIIVNYGTSTVSGNITVKGTNLCGNGLSSIKAIAVNPLPSNAGTISGLATVCQGQNTVSYSLPAITNVTSYIWSLPNGATGSSTTNTITLNYSTSAILGNITVKGHNSCGDGVLSNIEITVNPLPSAAGTITGLSTVCQSQNGVTYTIPPITNATSYLWDFPLLYPGTTTTNSITIDIISSAISRNYWVKGYNACGLGIPSILAITVNPLPENAGTISGLATVCQGQNSVVYTVPSITNATSYVWTLPSGTTGTSDSNSIIVNYGTSTVSGNITVKGTNLCGNGLSSIKAIAVNPLPSNAGTISGLATVCQGQNTVSYTLPAITNATSYIWSLANGATGVSSINNILVNFDTSSVSGSISVKGNNSCGNGAFSSKAITVNPLPLSAGTISGTATVCQGQNGVSYNVPAITNATSYIWTLPSGATASSTTNTITVNYGSSAVSGNITVKGHNSCGDGVLSYTVITVNPLPSAAGTITGPSTVCQSQNGVTYTIPPITNATSYLWDFPLLFPGTTTTNTITIDVISSAISRNYLVKGYNACGLGIPSILAITVNPLPLNAGVINGLTTVCQGQNAVTYCVPSITNATSYIWAIPNGATGTSTIECNMLNFSNTATSGNITVKGHNSCGDGVNSIFSVTVNPLPISAGTISGTTTVCQGQNGVTYNVPAITNATSYVWTLPSGATASSTTNTITVNYSTSAVSGNITVKGHSCGDGVTSTLVITVNPLPSIAGTISGLATVCLGQNSVVYTVSPISNASSYVWTLPSGTTGASDSNSIIVNYGTSAVSGNITVKGTNLCGNGVSSSKAITVNPLPINAGTITGLSTVCQGQNSVAYNLPAISNATSYAWTLPNGATGTSATNSIVLSYSNSAASGNITVKGHNSCGDGVNSILSLTVNPLPISASAISGSATVCQGQNSVNYTIPLIDNATSYIWTLPSGATASSSTNTITVNYGTSAASGNITVKGHNSCGDGNISSYAVTVNPLPSIAGTISGLATVCQGQNSVVYTVPSITNASTYVWTLPSGITGTSDSNSIIINYGISAVSGNILVKGNNACGDGISSSKVITINPLPINAGTITGLSTVCQGQNSVAYNLPAISNATSYVWTLPNGASGTSTSNSIILSYSNSASSGNITVKGHNSCGDGVNSILSLTVNPLPISASAISGSATVCQGQNSENYTVPLIDNASSYIWTLPSGATASSTTNTITVNYSNSAVSGNITVKGHNSCGDGNISSYAVIVNPLPFNAGTISGLATNCQGQNSLVYTVASITNATSYVWSLPNGVNGASSTNSITVDFTTSAISGNITVKGNNACGYGVSSSKIITVNPIPGSIGTITGAATVCQSQNAVLYKIPTVTNATSYIWTLPQGIIGYSTSDSIKVNIDTTAVTSIISVKAINACGETPLSSLAINVNPLPLTAGIISGLNVVCQGNISVPYSVSPILNATSYTWVLPSGVTGSSNSSSIFVDVIPSFVSGAISVKGHNACGNGNISSITLSKLITDISQICYVEFDTLTQKNKVFWSTSFSNSTDSIYIYRELSLGNWGKIGSTLYTNQSYVDITSNPMSQSYNYKIAALDSCNNESTTSSSHKTVTLIKSYDQLSSTYGFSWSAYEGIVVSQYNVFGMDASGNTSVIGTVPGNSFMFNYANPNPLFMNYFVGFDTAPCSAKGSKSSHTVKSNYVNSITNSINSYKIKHFKIYPNPFKNEIFIEMQENKDKIYFEIYNSIGQVVLKDNFFEKTVVQTTNFVPGIYFIKLINGKIFEFNKIIKN